MKDILMFLHVFSFFMAIFLHWIGDPTSLSMSGWFAVLFAIIFGLLKFIYPKEEMEEKPKQTKWGCGFRITFFDLLSQIIPDRIIGFMVIALILYFFLFDVF